MTNSGKSNFRIISFGDNIKPGVYKLHSAFQKVKNYNNGINLVSLVLEDIGEGPNNIVVPFLPDFAKIEIKKNKFYSDNITAEIKRKYYSKISEEFKIEKNILDFCVFALLKYSPPLSMAFVFDKKRRFNFKTGFQKQMFKKMESGIKFLIKNDYVNGTGALRGLGFGLTPSGDDFLSGLVLAMRLKKKYKDAKLILNNFKTKNILSYNALKNCFEKKVDGKIKNFINSVKMKNKRNILKALKDSVNKGHTSGSDFLSGFLFYFYLKL